MSEQKSTYNSGTLKKIINPVKPKEIEVVNRILLDFQMLMVTNMCTKGFDLSEALSKYQGAFVKAKLAGITLFNIEDVKNIIIKDLEVEIMNHKLSDFQMLMVTNMCAKGFEEEKAFSKYEEAYKKVEQELKGITLSNIEDAMIKIREELFPADEVTQEVAEQ